jgi:Flp pilus assembly pilin Flp
MSKIKGGLSTMNLIAKCYIKSRETLLGYVRGQTMTEYALILAAIAVVVYGVYAAMGNNIGSLSNGIDSSLTNA